MNILVIGGGAREHAICYAVHQSSKLSKLYAIPGNYGISQLAECHIVDTNDFDELFSFAIKKAIDLIIVGPEVPLVNGIVDFFTSRKIKIFGPDQFAAQLEGSKSFMKDLCNEHRIPTAQYEKFQNSDDAIKYLETQSYPIVIKADGLAAGKGVTIAEDFKTASIAVQDIFNAKFGANMDVVIEEFMYGEEASYFICSDGKNFISLISAQDHKRIGENDTGPNTGGMGAYSPAPVFTEKVKKQVDAEIIKPTLKAMFDKGHPFKGILYAGLMIENEKAKLVEYNIRFGDPECQVLMMSLKSDLIDLIMHSINGSINDYDCDWYDEDCATVVLASKGYPGEFIKDTEIKGLEKIKTSQSLQVFHAATVESDEKILANGGRVLSITAKDKSLRSALSTIYNEIKKIDWNECYYRNDIGHKALKNEH
jgi:phosphoribosylamine--glycine ligase